MFQFDGFKYGLSKKALTILLIAVFTTGFHFETFAQIPDNPQIDTVSIVDEQPVISWFPNETNTTGYSIYRGEYETVSGQVYLIWDSIASLYDKDTSYFIDANVSGCDEQRLYKMRAFNNENASNWLVADTMTTILITEIDFDLCANTISLEWTKYMNMVTQLSGYQILASENGGAFYVLASVPANQTSYTHTNPAAGISYSYKIRAFNEDGSRTSTSCQQTILTKTYAKPTFAHLLYATVEDNSHIRLDWMTDDAPISKFEILRSDDGVNFSMIDENEDLSTFSPNNVYIDNTADFNTRSYYYRINVCDSCGNTLFDNENLTRTIHLTGAPGAGYVNSLQWNEYMGWDLDINTYKVWRQIENDNASLVIIAELPSGTTSYQDDVSNLGNLEGSFVYYIEAVENDGDNGFEDFPDLSLSNRVIISQETSVLLPNAFIPGGMPPDNEFRPVASFIEQENYEMVIFNKWGQQLFVSREISVGWDGTHNGEYVPGGAYVYVIKFRNAQGQPDELQGTVTVIR